MSDAASLRGAADRNLLLGILALQMDFIDRETMIAAMNAWVLEKTKPLGLILQERGALGVADRELLDALVARHLAMHGGDAEKSLAALSSLGSARKQLARVADADIQASLSCVGTEAPEDPHATRPPTVEESTPTRMRFRILRPHRKGGLGEVYVAEDQELHREVALKEIQDRHADDPDSRLRFVREAEITGGLEHPGIVPVYGLGTYADGRPYYAMRFIRGDSLHDAIQRYHANDGQKRNASDRTLELRKLLGRFLDVCNAIGYAHSRGVLHRDLKPGNVMLGPYGETLVVDWGLAKPLDESATAPATQAESPLRPASGSGSTPTQMGQALGTPAYMSPEQAAGRLDQLGTASDVYSLGATLYHLLTSRPPVEGTDVGEVLQNVCKGQVTPPRRVSPTVPAALEAICLKAMALRPQDRYASPRTLADDVERWLADEPVAVHRESLRAQASRWARRHRALVTGAVALLVTAVAALAVGLIVLGHKQAEVTRQRDVAEREGRRADAINRFLIEDLLAASRTEFLDRTVTMLQALDAVEDKLNSTFADQPEVEASVRVAFGATYTRMGEYPKAARHLLRAQEIRRNHLGDDSPETLAVVHHLAKLSQEQGKTAEAMELARATLESRREILGHEHPDTLMTEALLGLVLWEWGNLPEAETILRSNLAARLRVLGAEDVETLRTINDLALVVKDRGNLREAEDMFRQNLKDSTRLLGARKPFTLLARSNLASVLSERGQYFEAEKLDRETLELRREVLGRDHRFTLMSMNNLATVLDDAGKDKEAEELQKQALAAQERVLGPAHPDTLLSLSNRAVTLEARGQVNEAEKLYRQCLTELERALGKDHRRTLLTVTNLAALYQNSGKLADAEKLFRQAWNDRRRVFGDDHPDTLESVTHLASALEAKGELDQAEQLSRKNVEDSQRVLGPDHPETLSQVNNLALLLYRREKLEEAQKLLRHVYDTNREKQGSGHSLTLITMANLAGVLEDRGSFDEAERLRRTCLETQEKKYDPNHPKILSARNGLATHYYSRDKFDEAAPLFRQCLDAYSKLFAADHPKVLLAVENMAFTISRQEQFDAAEKVLRDHLAKVRELRGDENEATISMMDKLGSLLVDHRKLVEAEKMFEECLRVRSKSGPDLPATLAARASLADVRADLGKYDDAEKGLQENVNAYLKLRGKEHIETLNSTNALAMVFLCRNKLAEAEKTTRELLVIGQRTLKDDDPTLAVLRLTHGRVLTAAGKANEAEPLLHKTLDIRQRILAKHDWRLPFTEAALGACLAAQKKYEQAEPMLLKAWDALKSNKMVSLQRRREVADSIIQLYDGWKKPEKAAAWRTERAKLDPPKDK